MMDPKKLASQLRCPSGEEAATAALKMNDANRSVNQICVELLQVTSGDRVIEIGPGNGAFAVDIVNAADKVDYTGVDWSADMVTQANQLNQALLAQGRTQFLSGSSNDLPFESASFDKALCVHAIYFWERAVDHLAEIQRVLKPGGIFCLAFGDRSFMKDLPFTPYGFTLYDTPTAEAELKSAGFRVIDSHQRHEAGVSNTGDVVDKTINILVTTPA